MASRQLRWRGGKPFKVKGKRRVVKTARRDDGSPVGHLPFEPVTFNTFSKKYAKMGLDRGQIFVRFADGSEMELMGKEVISSPSWDLRDTSSDPLSTFEEWKEDVEDWYEVGTEAAESLIVPNLEDQVVEVTYLFYSY